eukprot:313222-Prorocentrum_minimum.AAC.5
MASSLKWSRERKVPTSKMHDLVAESGQDIGDSLPPYICGGDSVVMERINARLRKGQVGLVSGALAFLSNFTCQTSVAVAHKGSHVVLVTTGH